MNPIVSALYPVALVPLATVAVVELYKRVKVQDWQGVITILVGAVIGLGAGFLHLVGLDPVMGLIAGLGAVGIHTTATQISATNPPA